MGYFHPMSKSSNPYETSRAIGYGSLIGGTNPDNPIVDHSREILERLTGADMRNAMKMVAARHELHRSMAEKV
ncbi:hypothetical protein Tco_0378117 [Tanacetum coccineum]